MTDKNQDRRQTSGVWINYAGYPTKPDDAIAKSVHAAELDARRAAMGAGAGHLVVFVPWDGNIIDALEASIHPPSRAPKLAPKRTPRRLVERGQQAAAVQIPPAKITRDNPAKAPAPGKI
jgi:hypothetical protein